jgi:hypothetical protein
MGTKNGGGGVSRGKIFKKENVSKFVFMKKLFIFKSFSGKKNQHLVYVSDIKLFYSLITIVMN